jgi:predicted MFS family arabinose efflux permease
VDSGGWQSGFRIVGATTALVAIAAGALLIRSLPEDVGLLPFVEADATEGAHQNSTSDAPLAQLVRTRKFVALMIGLMLFSAMMALQTNFSSIVREHGVTLAQSGTLIAILSVLNVFATLGFGALNDRQGPRFSYVISGGLLIVALLVFRFSDGFGLQGIAVLLFAIPAITPPIITPIVLRAAFGSESFETILGVGMASMPIGIALGAPLWGLVKDVTGSYDAALSSAMLITCAAVALVTFALKAPVTSSPS